MSLTIGNPLRIIYAMGCAHGGGNVKIPKNNQYILFGGNFVLANKMQWVADQKIEGLSSKQWFLLRTLYDMPVEPLPTITSLAKETDTSRQNVTKMLEALNRKGCVVLGDNPCDRRSRTVVMTEQGLQILDSMAKQSRGFFEELFDGISNDECAIAAKVNVKMTDNLLKMQEGMR